MLQITSETPDRLIFENLPYVRDATTDAGDQKSNAMHDYVLREEETIIIGR